jgi:GNAT superfamily N-acetyltransferase
VRGRGLATTLLTAALSWAWEVGYTTCAVEWLTANPLSSRFWPQRGFVPAVTRFDHRVDPRVAWAQPAP